MRQIRLVLHRKTSVFSEGGSVIHPHTNSEFKNAKAHDGAERRRRADPPQGDACDLAARGLGQMAKRASRRGDEAAKGVAG